MEQNEILSALQQEIENLKKEIENLKKTVLSLKVQNPLFEKWVTRKQVMEFLDYGATQMVAFEKSSGIITSKIGRRKFFLKASFERFLESNVQLD